MQTDAKSLTLEQLRQQNTELEQQNRKQARELAELSAKLTWYQEQFRLVQPEALRRFQREDASGSIGTEPV